MSTFPTDFTEEELTEWINSLDIFTTIGILEKIYKDLRDCAIESVTANKK